MRKILSVIIAFAVVIMPLCITASASDEAAGAVFSLNIVKETDDYVMVSARLESGSFNSLDIQFAGVSDKIEDCVYIEESDGLYMFFISAKRAGGAVMSLPYTEPGKYGFATTIAYDRIGEDMVLCKFYKSSPDKINANDISLTVISCYGEENPVETTVISNLPVIEDGHEHDYVEIIETVPETCMADGYVKYRCSCGSTYTEVIPAHEHTLLHMSSADSCTQSGLEFDFCTECSGVFNRQTKVPDGHKWGEWEIISYPTADADGYAERKCLNCSETESIELKSVFKNCTVDGTDVCGLRPGMDSAEFSDKFIAAENALSVSLKQIAEGKVGTGSTVTVVYESGISIVYDIIVYGDVTGDGWYDGQDALLTRFIASGLLSEENIGKAAYAASDCNHDGLTDEADAEILEQAGVLLAQIDQSAASDGLLESSSIYGEYINLIAQDTAAEETETESEAFSFFTFFEKLFMLIKLCLSILSLR